ncbi:hypothetical protein ACFO1B_24770 [Dactylosporangium siamense]|uniref:hypothetical protein n=1 Tax=Dactylosporangium siamense TaxID=685454 RepID=UPI0019446CB6|nr:hypothetical protein [Dactylosporangium siamense]
MSTGLALATVLGLIVAGPIALMRIPTHLQLTVTDTALVIEPQGLDSWWAGTGRVEVPLAAIASIRIVPRSEAPAVPHRHKLRPGALHLAGKITAGVHDGTFWDVRNGDQLLMITCRPETQFKALVLQFANPFATLTRTRTVVAHSASRSTTF